MSAAAPASFAILAALAAGGAALVVLGLAAAIAGRLARQVPVRAIATGLAGAGAVAALMHLALGAVPVRLVLPFLLAGVRPVLALDGISAFFLVALLPVGVAALALGAAAGGMAVLLGAAILVLLAGEAGTLALGLALAVMGVVVLVRPGDRDAEGQRTPVAWVGWLAVPVLAVALAVPAGDGRFASLRANPPEGWAAAVMLGMALAGGGALAGLAPLQSWLGRAAAVAPANGLAATVLTRLGLYVLVRVLFDLMGPGPAWWGVPLVLAGAAGAVRGAMRAAQADGVRGVLAGVAAAQSGLVALGLGMALAARGVDDGPAAGLALGGALFGVLAFGWAQALWAAVATAVETGAGTQALGRLGGLVQRMRLTAIGALAGALAVAVLPPGAGFAASWLLLQAAVTLPRGGGADWWLLGLVAAAALALSGALLGFAMLRVVGVALLGRPRSPRAAAAEEVAPAGRWLILGLAMAVLGCGLLPGTVLALAAPAVRLSGGILPELGLAGIAPLGLVLLVGLGVAAVALAVRARSPAGHRVAPAWEGGQGPAPAWLPFGDPAAQIGAASFAATLPPGMAVLARGLSRPRRLHLPLWAPLLRGGPALVGTSVLAMLGLYLAGMW